MVTQGAQVTTGRPPSAAPDNTRPAAEYDDPNIEYPASDGEPMTESDLQFTPLTVTVIVLRIWFAQRSDVYVAGDLLVYYQMNDNETRVGPDIFVVFGASGKHPRDSWQTWREGKAPDFVMEIASPSTWERDAGEKRRIYAGMGVTEYWRFDPTGECFTPRLIGETLAGGQYQRLPLESDEAGIIWSRSELLGLDICVLPGLELRLYDPAGGQWLYTPQENADGRRESDAARQAAEAALRAEEEARRAAEAALRESDAENERLRELVRRLEAGQ